MSGFPTDLRVQHTMRIIEAACLLTQGCDDTDAVKTILKVATESLEITWRWVVSRNTDSPRCFMSAFWDDVTHNVDNDVIYVLTATYSDPANHYVIVDLTPARALVTRRIELKFP